MLLKISGSILLVCLTVMTGCYSLNRLLHHTADTAESIAYGEVDSLGNDIQARLAGRLIDVSLNKPFQLAYDQTAAVGGTGLRLKFSAVTEESRCASDIQCTRAGRVTVLLLVSRNGAFTGSYSLTLSKADSRPETKKIDKYLIILNNVEPSVFTSYNRPLSSDYSLNLLVSK
jgi:hypothetical protein